MTKVVCVKVALGLVLVSSPSMLSDRRYVIVVALVVMGWGYRSSNQVCTRGGAASILNPPPPSSVRIRILCYGLQSSAARTTGSTGRGRGPPLARQIRSPF